MMTTHLAIAAGMSLLLSAASGTALAQSTSSTTSTPTTAADQRAEKASSATSKANTAAAAKTGKRWDGVNLKPVDERANARQGSAPSAVRDAPARTETGTGCHSKADDA